MGKKNGGGLRKNWSNVGGEKRRQGERDKTGGLRNVEWGTTFAVQSFSGVAHHTREGWEGGEGKRTLVGDVREGVQWGGEQRHTNT